MTGRAALLSALAAPLLTGCADPAPVRETAACDGVPELKLVGRVTDAANILDVAQEANLNNQLANYEQETRHQMVIATVPSLNGAEVANVGWCLGDRWEIGRKDVNDGIVVVMAPNERRIAISTGLGMEEKLTDAEALQVIRKMTPLFKSGDYAGGLELGISAVASETGGVAR